MAKTLQDLSIKGIEGSEVGDYIMYIAEDQVNISQITEISCRFADIGHKLSNKKGTKFIDYFYKVIKVAKTPDALLEGIKQVRLGIVTPEGHVAKEKAFDVTPGFGAQLIEALDKGVQIVGVVKK